MYHFFWVTLYVFPKCIFPKCILPKCIFRKSFFSKCIPPKFIFPKCIFSKCIFPKCIYPKCIFAKCTRLGCLLSFASLFYDRSFRHLSIMLLRVASWWAAVFLFMRSEAATTCPPGTRNHTDGKCRSQEDICMSSNQLINEHYTGCGEQCGENEFPDNYAKNCVQKLPCKNAGIIKPDHLR